MCSWHTHPLDLPFERDAELLLHASAHALAESFYIRGGCLPGVDEEIAVLLGNLCCPVHEAAAARFIDQLPSLVPGRILEGRAAGLRFNRLSRFALFHKRIHPATNGFGIARLAFQYGFDENHILRHAALAIDEGHVLRLQRHDVALAVDRPGFDEDVLDLAAVAAGVHPQCATD